MSPTAEAPAGRRALLQRLRDARRWRPGRCPLARAPVIFTPDVADVSVTRRRRIGRCRLAAASRAPTRSTWSRQEDAARRADLTTGRSSTASLTGFTDTGLRTGTEYHYRIATRTGPPTAEQLPSAGVVIRAVPEPGPGRSTSWTSSGQPIAPRCSWSSGRRRLTARSGWCCSDAPLPWPAGTRITPADAAGLREIPGYREHGTDGRDVLELRPPPGRHYVTALTMGRNAAVVGSSAEVWLVEPVRGLSAAGCTTRSGSPGSGPTRPPTPWSAGPAVSSAVPGASTRTRAAS